MIDIEPIERDIQKLCPCVLKRWYEMRELLDEMEIHCSTIETLRGPKRQKFYMEKGVSRTLKSKHLPQGIKGLSLAFDLVPAALLSVKGWGEHDPLWEELGNAARQVGLQWGWDLWKWDRAHFQLSKCSCKEEGLL